LNYLKFKAIIINENLNVNSLPNEAWPNKYNNFDNDFLVDAHVETRPTPL